MEEIEGFEQQKKLSINALCNITALNRLHELKVKCNEYAEVFEGERYVSLLSLEGIVNDIIKQLKEE